jgi:type I restriction enzyme, S subunit
MDFDLPAGWHWAVVSDIASSEKYSCVGGPFGSKLSRKHYVDAPGVPVIRGKNLGDDNTSFVDDDFVFVSEDKADTLTSNMAFPGDVVFTQRGTLGQVGYIPLDACFSRYVISQSQMKCTVDPAKADSRFVYAYFRSPYALGWIDQCSITTGVPHINLGILRAFPIPLPPLPEQRRIAAVLGALDDKIELNRKMNRTLEAMAQALFKSWFIDFDGHDDLVPSELGPIPRGWEVGKFMDVAKQHRLTVKPEEQEPDTPYIGLADMPQRAIALAEWGHASDATSAKAQFVENDFLFGKLRPYFKKVGVAPCDGVCSSDIIVVRPKENQWYGYTLGVLTLDAFIDFTTAVSTGTRMPRVSWKAMAGYDLAIPPKERAEEFDAFVRPTVERIKANTWESRTLAALRDTLLPKLISGEIRVPEAEDALQEAGL